MKNLVLTTLLFSSLLFAQNNENPTLLGTFTGNNCTAIAVTSNYAFLTEDASYGGLKILDVSDPSTITVVGTYKPADDFEPVSIKIHGNYAFVGSLSYPDLRILDISNVSSPQLVSRYEEYSSDIQIDGDVAYLASQTEGLIILNISNINSISEIGYFEPDGYAYSLFIKDNYAYVSFSSDGLRIVSITDKSDPVQAAFYDTDGTCDGVYVYENHLFIADSYNGLLIVDISDLNSLQQVGYYKPDTLYSGIGQVIVNNNYAYLADKSFGVRIVDISDISSPQEVGACKISGGSYKICLVDDKIYSINFDGLAILQNNLPTEVENEEESDIQFELFQNYPNPFNPSTTIRYSIPAVETGHPANAGQVVPSVRLVVYDILGREVETLVNQKQKPGNYEVNFDGSSLTSGLYFYKLSVGSFVKTKKMILLK